LTYTLQDTVKAVCVQHQPQVTISNFDGSIGPFQYNWSFGGTTNPVNLPNSGATSDTIAYYVDVVDACGNVFPDSIVLVVESLVPTFGISPNKNFLSKCITDTPSVTATLINSTLPPYQFYWSTGSSTSSTTLPNNGVNYDTLYYAVQLTDGCGNTVKDSVRLTTNFAVPEFTISPNDTVYASCPSTLVNVTLANNNTSTYGPYIHDWSTGQSGIPVQLSNSGISGDRQWHYVVSTNSCGMNTMDSILVINNFTQPELSLSPNDTIVVDCLPDSALVTVSVDNNAVGPFTYSWSNGASGNSTYFHDNGVNGSSIPFTVTATDVCGFSTAKNGVLFVNKTLKIDSLGSSPSISCNSTGLVFAMVSGQKGPVSYKWTDGTGGQMNASSWGNRPSNWYYFTVTDVGCSVSDSVFVAVKDAPFALATATPSSGFSPLTVVFANQSLNTTSYYWDFGNGQNINTSSKAPITMVYSDSGVYTAMLISSQDNCADTFYVNIIVKQKPIVPPLVPTINNFDLPNVFTPNEDGSNDEFKLNTNGVKNVVLIIQNRWGNVVFEGSGVNPEWDGRTKSGDLAKEGVYLYQYEVTTIEDEVISGQGFVHLKRK
ncbi:MAG: gliding motility-associated C-terminal domain-containing protein, partial [Bacteroidetes bacterium]|nr:gliding motility-associated C-terminal domain-containing protein [Bacteroidota bacterium]